MRRGDGCGWQKLEDKLATSGWTSFNPGLT